VGNVDEPLWEPIPGQRFIAPVLGVALFVELAIAITGSGLEAIDTQGPTVHLGFGSPSAIGKLLLERFLIAFEAASLLLLLAAVGAVVLAGRHRAGEGGPAGTPSEAAERNGETTATLRRGSPAGPPSPAATETT
jgi:hypothetical protein